MVSAEIMKWIMLIIVIAVVIFIIKAGMKIINIIVMIVCLGFCWYTFFTEEGSARFSIALSGHPIIAYTTGLKRDNSLSTKETAYYKSTRDVVVNGEKREYIKCYTKWIVRIPDVQ